MSDQLREKEELRRKRAEIDLQILELLSKRAQLSKDWGAKTPNRAATLPSTQRDTLESLANRSSGPLLPDGVKSIFREIHAACRALETPVRVSYVGLEGGTAYVAAHQQFGEMAEYQAMETVNTALEQLTRTRADFAVLPYESASEGPVHATLMALRQTELKIIAVHEVSLALCLLNRSGNINDVQKVYATAADRALAQAFLSSRVPKAVVMDVKSPVAACTYAADEEISAAIALEAIGIRHDLVPTERAIADEIHPRVRYCVISNRPASRTGKDATAFLFSLNDEPGSLFEVLKLFAEKGINLRKIESRPTEGEAWDYLFFLEVSGHITDRSLITAVGAIKKETKSIKVLGSYPIST
jgi:chorismate mutase / prephenate dehydratase